MLDLADDAVRRARAAGATLVVNDRPDIARMADADGVHVGQDDLAPAAARVIVGPDRIVGLSTHDKPQVARGREEPVNYLAIGPVFATASKADHERPVGIDGVQRAVAMATTAGRPVVAIGGITIDTAPRLIQVGAASVAVISDLFAGGVAERARDFLRALR